uniref:Uncharacterized protein n=1 Tax=Caenorhabditis tropicalis TaxID=1561998 RepID=A0A1I7USB3_9PELO
MQQEEEDDANMNGTLPLLKSTKTLDLILLSSEENNVQGASQLIRGVESETFRLARFGHTTSGSQRLT